MVHVEFTLTARSRIAADAMWAALGNWRGHADWIPATTITIEHEDAAGVGTAFVARTGVPPLVLVDRMVVRELDPERRLAILEKTGPVITGTAGFLVQPASDGCEVRWTESVDVPRLPSWCEQPLACIGSLSFRLALLRLERQLRYRGLTA